MKVIIKSLYYFIRDIQFFLQNDQKYDISLPFFSHLKLLFKGFNRDKYTLYNFKKNSFDNYLSDFKRLKTKRINGSFSYLLDNKLAFYRHISDYVRVPKVIAFINCGHIFFEEIHVDRDNHIAESIPKLLEICREAGGKLVLKPICGGGGKGIRVLELRNGRIYLANSELTESIFREYLLSLNNYILTEYIKQGSFADSLYPASVNTMRIITITDPDSRRPIIPTAVQRIGNKSTTFTDNFTSGGMSSLIDIETGELSMLASRPGKKENLIWHKKHPDTGQQIMGKRIPDWIGIKETILDLARQLPYISYCGWDVVLTDEGIVLIEGNNYSDINVIQVHGPLLVNRKLRDFYKYHKII